MSASSDTRAQLRAIEQAAEDAARRVKAASKPKENIQAKAFWFIALAGPAYLTLGSAGAALWKWFVLPVWASAPHLTAAQFAGLWIVVRYIRGFGAWDQRKPDGEIVTPAEYASQLIMTSVLLPLLILFFGWVIKAAWL